MDSTLEGVLVYQFFPEQVSSFVVASAVGWVRVDGLPQSFNQLLHAFIL